MKMYIVSKNSFNIGKELAEGSFGGVYESSFDHANEDSFCSIYAVTNVAVREYVYKGYKNYVNPDGYVLSTFTDFYYSLSANAQNYLNSICCWPHVLVGDGDNVSGFLMIRIPEKFFCTINFSGGPKVMEAKFEHLLIPENLLERRKIPLTDKARYKLLLSVVRGLNFFHEHGICIGDFSHSNILFSLEDCSVFFIDCDSFSLNGNTVFAQTETGNWGVAERYPEEEAGTKESDIYKLGLLALRLLMKSDNSAHYQASTNIDRLPANIDAGVKAIIEDSLKDAPNRPTLAKWSAVLDIAIMNCASDPLAEIAETVSSEGSANRFTFSPDAVSPTKNTPISEIHSVFPTSTASRNRYNNPPPPQLRRHDNSNANPSTQSQKKQSVDALAVGSFAIGIIVFVRWLWWMFTGS
jgi:serine/threonine protein kinase